MDKKAQQSIINLRERFLAEQNDIQKYVHFLQDKANIFFMDIVNLLQGLMKLELLPYDTRQQLKEFTSEEKIYDRLDKETLQNIYDVIQPFKLNIEQILEEVAGEIFSRPAAKIRTQYLERLDPNNAKKIDEALEIIISFIITDTKGNIRVSNLDGYRQGFLDELQTIETAYAHSPILQVHKKFGSTLTKEDIKHVIECAIELALYRIKYAKLNFVFAIKEKIEQVEVALKMSSQKENMNILRQGFINLMAIFDVIMFDIVRVVLMNNFFNLIEHFNKPTKARKEITISINGLHNYSSFEDFKEKIIEAHLKNCYLKDILLILEKLDTFHSKTKGKYEFGRLIELIMRRNIHLHNGGRVDERYLEEEATHIYGLELNVIAVITSEYWELANQLCKECVEMSVDWALKL
jgi:hypothetical protein